MQDEATRRRMLQFVQIADLGISDVKVEEPDPELLKRLQRATMILAGRESEADAGDMEVQFNALGTLRLSHSGALGDIELDASDESLGTLVWLGLLSPLLDALDAGSVLLADELDSSLHPRLVEQVARLFQDPETNPRNAQLIANLFDTSLLGDSVTPRVIGRDQVWLCEKGADGASALTPLSDFAPRKQEDLAGRYLRGRYGGVPLVDHHEFAAALESQR
jgi:AAA15 family ATPase/GTPase